MEEVTWDTPARRTRMSDHPDDLLRELEVAEPRLKRLSFPWPVSSGGGPKDFGAPERHPLRDRARDWIASRMKRDAATDWLRLRFLPWLGDQTTRGTRAAQAFWSALEPEERERLWNIIEELRRDRRTAVRSLDQRDVGQISTLVYRGLVAARQAWQGDATKKAK